MITEYFINQKAHFERKYLQGEHGDVTMITASIGGIEVKRWYFHWSDQILTSPADLYSKLSSQL